MLIKYFLFKIIILKNEQRLTEKTIPVMYDDGYDSSQNVAQTTILTPAEINSLFNSFTYDKGSSILFMLESTVGYDNFRDGLKVINNKHVLTNLFEYICLI